MSALSQFLDESWLRLIGTRQRREVRGSDKLFLFGLRALALAVVVLFAMLFYFLVHSSWPALTKFGPTFFIRNEWNPVREDYGALAFLWGTCISSLLAVTISVPISLGAALYLTELAPRRLKKPVAFLIEMLAAIPSVVYGLWGVFVLAPWMRTEMQPLLKSYFPTWTIFSGPPFGIGMLTSGIILAIMITPTITSIAREIFKATPEILREAALALGATRWEMIWTAVVKSSFVGVFGAVMLGLGRALGETMAVTMVIGNRTDISLSLFSPASTMASVIANEYAEANGRTHLSALWALALCLFLLTLIVNLVARFIISRVTREARRAQKAWKFEKKQREKLRQQMAQRIAP